MRGRDWLCSQLGRLPRVGLAHLPTPLEPLPRLSRHLGGPSLYVKRDDCTGLAMGGNKARQLEFLMADALAQGADIVLTHGAVQSNHVRQTAAAAAKLGLDCQLLLEQRVPDTKQEYEQSGNVLLDHLLGADIVERLPAGTDMTAALEELADRRRREGRRPYIIPGGAACPLGALGYVAASLELLDQCRDLNVGHVLVPAGSGGTQAGLVTGLHMAGSDIAVTGISTGVIGQKQGDWVHALATATARLIGDADPIPRDKVRVLDGYHGRGYGHVTPEALAAIQLAARLEGLLLDPVYTGKAMAGLIDLVRSGRLPHDQNVVFMMTGGTPGLFAYRGWLDGSAVGP